MSLQAMTGMIGDLQPVREHVLAAAEGPHMPDRPRRTVLSTLQVVRSERVKLAPAI